MYCRIFLACKHTNNLFSFKFSWFPENTILLQLSLASFIFNFKKINIAAEDLIAFVKLYFVIDDYEFVAYANYNFVYFKEFYKILKAKTIVKKLLKYNAKPIFVKIFINISWLNTTKKNLAYWTLNLASHISANYKY